MDAATLAEAMGRVTGVDYHALAGPFTDAMQAADITNVNRAAMWCAQLGHESVGLKYMREIHDGSNYEGRRDLGNVHPGDGRRFRGRGPIQITGRNNYATLSRWAHGRGLVPTPTFFVDDPVALEQPRYGFLGAVWYWTVARPQINGLADARNLEAVTRAINGGLNGIDDRRNRYHRCLAIGGRLLTPGGPVAEKVLDYPRDQVVQDTGWNCGPASVQTAIRAAGGPLILERDLARELGTHQGGTDWIGQFPAVLNRHIPGAQYRVVEMPNDPPTPAQRDRLWNDIVSSINAGHGVVVNIVAPPSNYPRAVAPSTISPAYSGGTVYHYFLAAGYSDGGGRRVWIADSGFSPYGYWISLDQLATLVPPKGYAYSATPTPAPTGGFLPMLNDAEQRELLQKIRDIHRELTQRYPSRSAYRTSDKPVDSLAGMLLNVDARVHEDWVHARASELGITPEQFQRDYLGGKK
ncbi:MAG: C39 family peptidase [Dietzia sp.]